MGRRPTRVLGAILVIAGFVAAYGGVVARLVRVWASDQNYSHAFLIAAVAGYLAWQRRAAVVRVTLRPHPAGLALLGASLLMLGAGRLGAEVFLSRLSLPGAIAGTVLFIGGRRALAAVAFPLVLVLLVIPPPSILFTQVTLPLQQLASRLGEFALWAVGIPVLREGNIITLAHARLEVAEACSGIRSLMSLVALAALYTYFSDSRRWMRAMVTAAAVPIAIVVNGLRIAATGVLAHLFCVQAAEGFFHAFSGWLMFIAAFGLLVTVHRAIAVRRPQSPRAAPVLQSTPS